jgi:dipeptidyl aminopeptidase/acylaminoacyl peptidase
VDALTLDDVLGIKYLAKWEWGPADRLAYLCDDGGRLELWVVDAGTGRATAVSAGSANTTDFAWHPHQDRLLFIADGNLWEATAAAGGGYQARQLCRTAERESHPAWSPDGDIISYVRAGGLWFHHHDGLVQQVELPGRMAPMFGGAAGTLCWSPAGDWLAFGYMDTGRELHAGVVARDGQVVWQSAPGGATGLVWLDRSTLLIASSLDQGHRRVFRRLELAPGRAPALTTLLEVESDGRGPAFAAGPFPSPDGRQVLYLLENDGWAHLYFQGAEGGAPVQVTEGECEDYGHAGDSPRWAPGGHTVVYASNRGRLSERQLWTLDVATGTSRPLTALPGTNVQPKFSADGRWLAFVHCDPWQSADLWLMASDRPETAHRLTCSMPPAWTRGHACVPQEVSYRSAGGRGIQAQLVCPPGMDPGRTYPALVWVHGGPIRQMRWGWHPMRTYALFYAVHQYLAHRGYVSLAINFRGGIGYGRNFRQALYHKMGVDDVADAVNAARFLKSLPYVDPQRVGVWGISYGGYMTLHCLTQYPEEFALGINIAGIWDFAQWQRWVRERWGRSGGLFNTFLGGEPEDSPELYAQASPATFADRMRAPLVNLHGTADANVDFAQLDRIVKDCVRLGKDYEAHYYPGEAHTFAHRHSWKDALAKVEAAMDRYLKV